MLIAACVACTGCGRSTLRLAHETHAFQPHEYGDIYRKWSRDLYIIPVDGVENVLTARATYLGHEFRWAYVVRVAYDLRLSPAERQELHESEFGAISRHHEFFVTVMSGLERSDELDPEKADWLVRLEDDRGRKVSPIEVAKVKKPTYTEVKSFEFDPLHRTAYRVTFPVLAEDNLPILSPETRYFSLTFSSSMGQGDMRWELVPDSEM